MSFKLEHYNYFSGAYGKHGYPPPAIFTKYEHLLAGTGLELAELGTQGFSPAAYRARNG